MNSKKGNIRIETKGAGRTQIEVNRQRFRSQGERSDPKSGVDTSRGNAKPNNRPEITKPNRRSALEAKFIRHLKEALLEKQNELNALRKQLNATPHSLTDIRNNINASIAKVQADISRIKKRLRELRA